MKLKFIALVAFMATFSSHALTHKYPCDELVYDALTYSGKKRLQLCKSLDQINYNFGSRDGRSELDILLPVTTSLLYPKEEVLEMYRFEGGDYIYSLMGDELVVAANGKVVSVITMQKPFVNKIVESLLPYGVPVAN